MTWGIPLLVLAGVALWLMSPDERRRLYEAARDAVADLLREAVRGALRSTPDDEPFRRALWARTQWVLVVPALAALNALVFVFAALSPGSLAEPATLIAWGANYAPVTTNGEWWRLLTSLFVHYGPLHLAATLAGLVPLGLLLERWIGSAALATVYLASGLVSGLVHLSIAPIGVGAGAAGAVFGVYGLLAAAALWSVFRRPPFRLPQTALRMIAAMFTLFLLHTVFGGALTLQGALAGLATGFAGGMAIGRGVSLSRPPVRRAAAMAVATLVIAVIWSIPLRGLVNVLPELQQVVATETRTSSAYAEVVEQFRKGWTTSDALAAMIDDTILPELTMARARLVAMGKVPHQHQPFVEAAAEYFDLRQQGWELRSRALRTSSLRKLQEAEAIERAALRAFARLPSD